MYNSRWRNAKHEGRDMTKDVYDTERVAKRYHCSHDGERSLITDVAFVSIYTDIVRSQ